mgnify:CR=1 FL=1
MRGRRRRDNDRRCTGCSGPADSTRDDQWWLKSLNVSAVHDVTRGEGVVVAVVDSGVDADHPDLRGNVLPGADLFDQTSKGHDDTNGHGTAMASLIAGHGHGAGNRSGILGVAPEAKILPVKVMRDKGVNPPANVATGIDWAIDSGADVISVSIAGATDPALLAAVDRAYQRNIPLIAGVGNKSTNLAVNWPAGYPGAIGATILGRDNKPTQENVEGDRVDIAAPGEDIVAAYPGGRYSTAGLGSSNSTAIVAGAVALVRSKFPDLNSYDLSERLLWTTRDVGAKGWDDTFGYGALDVERAVTGEPDDRSVSAAPTPAVAAAPAVDECRGCPSTATRVLQIIALFGGLLVVIGVVVFLLIRRKRKTRRAALGTYGPPGN